MKHDSTILESMNDLARQCSTTHTCDDDLDLVECGGLLGTEEQGAYHLCVGQVLAILHGKYESGVFVAR